MTTVEGAVKGGATPPATRRTVTRTVAVAHDHPAFAGHFPGRPVLPGVALVAEVMESIAADSELAAIVGSEPRLAMVKFSQGVLPGTAITLTLSAGDGGIDFTVVDGRARVAASGRFAASSSPS